MALLRAYLRLLWGHPWKIIAVGVVFCVLPQSSPAAYAQVVRTQAVSSPEYHLKATFLFNFAQFVEWPAHAFSDDQSPLIIGVLGEDPFRAFLDEIVQGETVNNHPLLVQRYQSVDDIEACHILFISQAEIGQPAAGQFEQIIASLEGRAVLTVSDAAGFAESGGMIHFITEQNKIRLRINVDAAQAVGVVISSKLLRLADLVSSGGN